MLCLRRRLSHYGVTVMMEEIPSIHCVGIHIIIQQREDSRKTVLSLRRIARVSCIGKMASWIFLEEK